MSSPTLAAPAAVLLPALAWRPVLVVAAAVSGVLLAVAGRYGYHRDELYFRLLADAPAWGYVDQPPLTPLLARAAIELFGDTVWALRVPAALLAGLLAVLLALIAREVGAGRVAQLVAAFGAASATPLVSGHILLTASLDWPLWVAAALFVIRAQLRGQPRWWLLAGATIGVALLNKLLIVLLVVALPVGLLLGGAGRTLRGAWPWAGAATAIAIGSPSVGYQLLNGLPQAEMAGSLTGEAARLLFVPAQALALGPPAVAIWGAGLVALLRRPAWRPIRAIALAYLLVCALLLLLGGQFYYTVGLLLVSYAIGATVAEQWVARGRAAAAARRAHLYRAVTINTVASAVVALPVLPLPALAASPVAILNPAAGDQVGWRTYTADVAAAVATLSPEERRRSVVIADNYGEAGAFDRYRADYGLPPVVSGHKSLYDLARPADDVDTAVVVMQGEAAPAFLSRVFASCVETGRLDNRVGVGNEEHGTAVRVCREPLASWDVLWPQFRYVGLSTFCEPCRRLNLT